MTLKEFEEVYDKATDVCRMKCNHEHAHSSVRYARDFNDIDKRVAALNAFKVRNKGQECYDCACSPDMEFMFKELKRRGAL